MWVMVLFDLPTETKKQRKAYTDFRKVLLSNGFRQFQLSIYCRSCPSKENAEVHMNRLSRFIPEAGKVCIMCITDKQFGDIKIYYGVTKVPTIPPSVQLELF